MQQPPFVLIPCPSFPGSDDFVLLNTCNRNGALFPNVLMRYSNISQNLIHNMDGNMETVTLSCWNISQLWVVHCMKWSGRVWTYGVMFMSKSVRKNRDVFRVIVNSLIRFIDLQLLMLCASVYVTDFVLQWLVMLAIMKLVTTWCL